MNVLKKIIIINQESGYLMVDIANTYIDDLFDVTLITGRLVQRDTPLSKKVRILKIIPYKRDNTFFRLSTWIIGTIQIIWHILSNSNKCRLLIVTNPPFSTFLPLIIRNPYSLLIFDVYPDALTNIGIVSYNSIIIKLWQNINRKVFNKAERIFTLTEAMKANLRKYSLNKPIQVVPIWANINFFQPLPKTQNIFLSKFDLKEKFIVMYSGNLGKTHPVEVLVDVASMIKNPRIYIFIIGNGAKYSLIKDKIIASQLNNIRIIPLQPVSELPLIMNAADLGVVTLEEKASEMSIPSKTFSMMAAGLPILGIGGKNSELNNIITNHNIGKLFLPNQIDEICAFINNLAETKSELLEYSQNSLKAAEQYSPENAKSFLYVSELP